MTRFLNVDLDLFADGDLGELVRALAPRLFLLHHEHGFWCFELERERTSAEEVIREVVAVVHALPPPSRALWDACTRRRMNLGVQAGAGPHPWQTALSHEALTLLVGVGAEVAITVYGASQGEPSESLTPR